MKTMKRNIMIIVMAAAFALPTMAQTFGSQAERPNAVFQSTSVMQGSGSAYRSHPMLNRDGTAAYSCSSPVGGPLRAKKDGNPFDNGSGGTVNIGEVVNPNEPGTPLGDALIPLAVMALAFGAVVAVRRRRSAEKN